MPLEDFIITVFCLVDEECKKLVHEIRLRKRGFKPKLSDSEVITMEIVAEFMGIDTDKQAWKYFNSHWKDWFPMLCSRSNFAKHAVNLWYIKQNLQKKLAKQLGALSDDLHIVDGFPMPVCHFKRAFFSHTLEEVSTYGYCASKDEKYYGLKGNLLINSKGVITDITVTSAHIDERESLWDLVGDIRGMLIGDKGFIDHDLKENLRQSTGINLQTALRSNMKEERSPEFKKWLVSKRRLVETVIGQLVERFQIAKVRARKVFSLTDRIARKILSHTISMFINEKTGNPPLQFDLLVKQ